MTPRLLLVALGLLAASCAPATPCTVATDDDGVVTVRCPDGTSAVVAAGADGADGAPGADGTPGADGDDGLGCSVVDHGDGTATITCGDGTSATVRDGLSDLSVVEGPFGATSTATCPTGTIAVSGGPADLGVLALADVTLDALASWVGSDALPSGPPPPTAATRAFTLATGRRTLFDGYATVVSAGNDHRATAANDALDVAARWRHDAAAVDTLPDRSIGHYAPASAEVRVTGGLVPIVDVFLEIVDAPGGDRYRVHADVLLPPGWGGLSVGQGTSIAPDLSAVTVSAYCPGSDCVTRAYAICARET